MKRVESVKGELTFRGQFTLVETKTIVSDGKSTTTTERHDFETPGLYLNVDGFSEINDFFKAAISGCGYKKK